MGGKRDTLLVAVRARIGQTIRTDDPQYVLEPEAVAEVRELIQSVMTGGDIADLEVRHAAG